MEYAFVRDRHENAAAPSHGSDRASDIAYYRELAARYLEYVSDSPSEAFPTFMESLYFETVVIATDTYTPRSTKRIYCDSSCCPDRGYIVSPRSGTLGSTRNIHIGSAPRSAIQE